MIGKVHPSQATAAPELVPDQEHLTSYIPTVMGTIEFRLWKHQLDRIHELLGRSGVEQMF